MPRPRTGREKPFWNKVLGENPSTIFQEEKSVVDRIAALVGVEDLIRARFTGTLHVFFDRGLPRSITKKAAPRLKE